MTAGHLIASLPVPNNPHQRLFRRVSSRRVLLVFAALTVAGGAIAPFYFAQRKFSPGDELTNVISYHDLVEHVEVMEQFDKVLRSGVMYPRWLSGMNNGYGNAWTNFYPPGFYYLTSLIHSVVADWLTTLFLASVLVLAGSGLAMYVLSRALYGRVASSIAALLYMLLPFHILNFYWQGAMPQFTGFLFLPLVLYFAFRLGKGGRARHYAGLGLSYGLYVLIHLPVSYLMSYALAFYTVIWALSERDWRITVRIAGGMAIGLLLSAIYWLPALVEAKYAYENVSNMFPYERGYLLLLPPGDIFTNILNHSFLLQTLLLFVAIVILRSTPLREALTSSQTQTRLLIIVGIATTFMVTSLSLYPSKLIPKIEVAVFPWRWIAVASVFTSLLAGAAAERLTRPNKLAQKVRWASCAAMIVVVMLNLWITVQFGIITPISNPTIKSTAGLLEANYTPRGSTLIPASPDNDRVIVQPDGGASEIIRWDPQYRLIALRVDQPSEVRLKTYNFSGWTARIDGQRVPVSSDKDGVQVIDVPPGRHQIEAEFADTTPRTLGAVFFGLGLMMIASLTIVDYRRGRAKGTVEPRTVIADDEINPQAADAAAEQLISEAGAAGRMKVAATALVLTVIAVIAGYILIRRPASGNKPPAVNSTAGATASNAAGGITGVGSEARLSAGSMNSIPVAVDEKALDELMSALPMGNNDRVEELIRSGSLFRVQSNTRVRVLEFRSAKLKIRILEGESLTLDGWVPERWIRPL